jgi:hypothetical protein
MASAGPRYCSRNAGFGGDIGSRFTSTVRAPEYSAERTKFEAGDTVPDVPTAMNRSHSRSACLAARSASTGIGSSKSTTPGRMDCPHSGQLGGDGLIQWDAGSQVAKEQAGQVTRANCKSRGTIRWF